MTQPSESFRENLADVNEFAALGAQDALRALGKEGQGEAEAGGSLDRHGLSESERIHDVFRTSKLAWIVRSISSSV